MIRGDEGTEVRGYENTYNVALLRVKSILVPPYLRTPENRTNILICI